MCVRTFLFFASVMRLLKNDIALMRDGFISITLFTANVNKTPVTYNDLIILITITDTFQNKVGFSLNYWRVNFALILYAPGVK